MKSNKLLELLKEKQLVIPMYIYKLRDRFNIDLECFMFLMYLYNIGNKVLFDINNIANDFGCDVSKVLAYISSLQDVNLIDIEVIKNDKNVREEYISLDVFYNKVSSFIIEDFNKKIEENETVFDVVEKGFGRTLSPIEYEIVKAWIESKYSEELIREAVKEAIFSGVNNLRYIDKILYEWGKKGFKSKEDVEKNRNAFREEKPKSEVFDYDWMDDEES